ncbi:TRAP transporter fused permease subunit [Azospirillum sp. RWY-5-1]|uniref:TRAP transporter fused permease subunit n=1 Tax=Azospirillum oleiclasticum TaxID=2735135 RepID=A0ABX2T9D9_9PROT|nr:TRAP transporter fused permease subunit [Azospirillum oleiclasticum]NYZ13664.1 TRAP transporter fused permease subunit [Azospirillum oleiclasticum]NYZ20936.1 TRAP transporter fused permease subunit [Azospirillum oleiclasticum]
MTPPITTMPGELIESPAPAGRLEWLLNAVRWPLELGVTLAAILFAGVGLYDEVYTRSGLVLAAGIIILLSKPLARGRSGAAALLLVAVDLAIGAGLLYASWRFVAIQDLLFTGLFQLDDQAVTAAWIGVAAVLELTRRLFGPAFAILAAALIGYALYGDRLPGALQTLNYYPEEVARVVWFSFDGVYGQMLSIVVASILIYIVFGTVLEASGAGQTLIRVAFALSGGSRGGPAYAAVISSALFGTISGSVTANVVATGVMTIPLAKKRGFPARFAGAVEAAASSAGQFTPPVMGAVAFIMADLTGVPYLTVCLMATLPALLYFAGLIAAIAVEADRLGLKADPGDVRVRDLRWSDLPGVLVFLIPLVLIVGVILAGRSQAQSGLIAVLVTLVLSAVLLPGVRRQPRLLLDGLRRGGEAAAQIVMAVAAVGIIVGILTLTGLGTSFAGLLGGLGSDSLILGLIAAMVGCLILGMGMPTVPAYLVIILVLGPGLSRLGVETPIIHLFVIYFAVLSSLTPPVALAAFAAAPIAGANPIAVGVTSVRIALGGFLIPFAFVFHPSLTLTGDISLLDLAWAVGGVVLAMWLLTTAVAGHSTARIAWWSRLLRPVLAVAVIQTDPLWAIAAFVGSGALIYAEDWKRMA